MVMGVCGASKVNNWTVFDSLDLTSQQQEQEKGLLGRTDRGPTKMGKEKNVTLCVLAGERVAKGEQDRLARLPARN